MQFPLYAVLFLLDAVLLSLYVLFMMLQAVLLSLYRTVVMIYPQCKARVSDPSSSQPDAAILVCFSGKVEERSLLWKPSLSNWGLVPFWKDSAMRDGIFFKLNNFATSCHLQNGKIFVNVLIVLAASETKMLCQILKVTFVKATSW